MGLLLYAIAVPALEDGNLFRMEDIEITKKDMRVLKPKKKSARRIKVNSKNAGEEGGHMECMMQPRVV